ncbi:MAG: nucleoside-diphosphate kinase [Bacteroidota bacterium]|nr:nucleoside-diphosphate kinase [Bacteroidota bacterium]
MANKTTFTIIKPTAVKKGYIGGILNHITGNGFRIKAMKMVRMSKAEAEVFYFVHKDRPFYGELTDFMSSGPVVVAVLEGDNAVDSYRKLIGATNPAEAEEGTVRVKYGTDIQANAVHGSDSDENAEKESNYFFAGNERFSAEGKNETR